MPTLRHHYQRSCSGKRRYANELDAQAAARSLAQDQLPEQLLLRVYACEFCAGWHVGHQKVWRRKS